MGALLFALLQVVVKTKAIPSHGQEGTNERHDAGDELDQSSHSRNPCKPVYNILGVFGNVLHGLARMHLPESTLRHRPTIAFCIAYEVVVAQVAVARANGAPF